MEKHESEHAAVIANAFSEGINCVAYLQSLRAEPPVVSSEDLLVWHKALDDFQFSLKTFREGVVGFSTETSIRVSDDFVTSVENIRAHLSTLTPGMQLPATLFDLADVVWAKFIRSMPC